MEAEVLSDSVIIDGLTINESVLAIIGHYQEDGGVKSDVGLLHEISRILLAQSDNEINTPEKCASLIDLLRRINYMIERIEWLGISK